MSFLNGRLASVWRLDSPHWPRIVSALLVCALATESFAIVHANFWPSKFGPGKRDAVQNRGLHAAGIDLAAIRSANLFGAAAGAEAVSGATIESSLILSGVIAADDPSQGMALLTDAAGKTSLLSVGAPLASGGTLREVYADHVVLAVAGGYSLVYFKRNGLEPSGGFYVPPVLANSPVFHSIVSAAPGIPPGATQASRLALEREANPPDLSLVPPPAKLPPDQLPPKTK